MRWTERKVQQVGESSRRISILPEFYEGDDFETVEEAVVGDFLIVKPAGYSAEPEERTVEYSGPLEREGIQEGLLAAIAGGADRIEMPDNWEQELDEAGAYPLGTTPEILLEEDTQNFIIRDQGGDSFDAALYAQNIGNYIHYTLKEKTSESFKRRNHRKKREKTEQVWAYELRDIFRGPDIVTPEPEELRALSTAFGVRKAISNTYILATETEYEELAEEMAGIFVKNIEDREFGVELRDTLEDSISGEIEPEDLRKLDQNSDSITEGLDNVIDEQLAATEDKEEISEIRRLGSVSKELAKTPAKLARDAQVLSHLES